MPQETEHHKTSGEYLYSRCRETRVRGEKKRDRRGQKKIPDTLRWQMSRAGEQSTLR